MGSELSKRALDRLGDRLICAQQIDEDDYRQLEEALGRYQPALDGVCQVLSKLGYAHTSRLKTTGTLLDKLRRQSTLILESLGDRWGREIRYDDGLPRDPDQVLTDAYGAQTTRRGVMELMTQLSQVIDGYESRDLALRTTLSRLARLPRARRLAEQFPWQLRGGERQLIHLRKELADSDVKLRELLTLVRSWTIGLEEAQ